MTVSEKNIRFREWVEQYYEYGFRIARHILLNEEEARDMVQDAFVKVWEKIDQYRIETKFSTWFYRIMVNLCIDRLRKSKNSRLYAEQSSYNKDFSWDPAVSYNQRETRECIKLLAERLSPKQRMVFVLKDLEDLDMEEVCRVTELPPGQVKANLYYARKSIREMLIRVKAWEERK